MARLISAIVTKSRNPVSEERLDAARTFQVGQDVRAGRRKGKVMKIDYELGIIVIACGKRTQGFAAEIVKKIG